MKVLFVCKANIFRSQMATTFFREFCDKQKAESAGTEVVGAGERLSDREEKQVKWIIEILKREGVDVSENKRRLLTKKMVDRADRVICMAQRESIPDFLLKSGKMEYWEVEDATPESDYDFFLMSAKKIKKKVKKLVEAIC